MFSSELWQKSGVSTYSIDQSIRFNNWETAYMKRTPSSSGNQRTWTLSMWVKRGELGNYGLFGTRTGNTTNFFAVEFNSDDLFVQGYASGSQTLRFETTAHFRDVSAWYHIVLVADTTNAVSSERIRIYVNGERITSFASATQPTQNYDTHINSSSYENAIGCYDTGSDRVFSGYMTDIVMLDGTVADPSSFGETNDSGIWIPKDVSGLTFGTNGFYIDGRDSSDLGDDESGQGNDYTTTGLAAHDQVFDTPTNNFCVLNPISKPAYGSYMDRNVTGVNLQVTENGDGAVGSFGFGTFVISSGKWYYEIYTNTLPAGNAFSFGWIDAENAETATDSGTSWKLLGINQRSDYSLWQHGMNVSTATGGTSFSGNHTLGVFTDFDNNIMTITLDGSSYITKDFDSTSPTYLLSGVPHYPQMYWGADGSSLCTLNFGQDSTFNGAISAGGNADGNGHGNFKYTVPTGALAICSKNLGS